MRRIGRLATGVLAVFVFAAPVSAHDGCHLDVEQISDVFFFFAGTGFAPDETVTIDLFFDGNSVLAPVELTADNDGAFGDGLTFFPEDPAGEYQMTATADSCSAEATFQWLPTDTATASIEDASESGTWRAYFLAAVAVVAFAAALASRRRLGLR